LSSKPGSADGERPTVVESSESSASVTYPSGAKLELRLAENGKITCAFEMLPSDTTGFLFSLAVRRQSIEGGVIRFGEQAVTVPESGDKVQLVANARGLVSVADSTGGGVQIDFPGALQSLLDLRQAGVDEFSLRFQKPVTAPNGEFTLTVEPLTLR
jgi:hypothetical protein